MSGQSLTRSEAVCLSLPYVRWFGTGEGREGYDTVEHIASLSWCSGKVSLVGNSWLGAAQWLIGAEKPPHLTCFAPLEGFSDFYRETVCRGGVPYEPFWGFLATVGIIGRLIDNPLPHSSTCPQRT